MKEDRKEFMKNGFSKIYFSNVHTSIKDVFGNLKPILHYSLYSRGISFVLRWQINPTQMKCICNTNYSTYILFEFLIKIR